MVQRLPRIPYRGRCERCGRPSTTAYCNDCLGPPEHPVTGPQAYTVGQVLHFDRRRNGTPFGPGTPPPGPDR
jgi:hypothetical protein